MDKNLEKFMSQKSTSKARILDKSHIEVIDPSGDVYSLLCPLGKYDSGTYKEYVLHHIELIFDHNFSDDKELMHYMVWRDLKMWALGVLGLSLPSGEAERVRLGAKLRQIRDERGLESREVARLAGVDPANYSRIENGKYSVGLDIFCKIVASLGKKVDIVDL